MSGIFWNDGAGALRSAASGGFEDRRAAGAGGDPARRARPHPRKELPLRRQEGVSYDLLRVEMRGVEESRRDVFAGRFFRKYIEQEVRSALRDGGCRFPDNLRVDVEPVAGLPKPGEDWLLVEAVSQERADAGTKPVGKLIVREGDANAMEVRLDKARTNIGRVVDVYRSEGLFRRNDLAFEADTEINRSVSREHAHIQYDRAAGECRLFNDRWYERGPHGDCATWIVRDGMSQEVHRISRGAKLEAGDEIRFGKAVVTFEWEV